MNFLSTKIKSLLQAALVASTYFSGYLVTIRVKSIKDKLRIL